jgi:murein DD-endopeptidase MepM/ murein hydrolase activator NlpD
VLLVVAVCAAGCSRPVLYYPTPAHKEDSDEKAAKPVSQAGEADGAPALMTIGGSAAADIARLRSRSLLVPVAGASMSKVEDSFSDSRDGGRVHRAIDILAPRGTPVLSADAGRVLRLTTGGRGGNALYAEDAEGRFVYYYAHMDRYHKSMKAGRELAKGDTIGFVGTTGNAPKNTPHLHFQVMRMATDGRYWDGEPINPYELLIESERMSHASMRR